MTTTATKQSSIPDIFITHAERQDDNKNYPGAWIKFPRLWVDEFMLSNGVLLQRQDGSQIAALKLPSSFTKFSLHLWRWISIPAKPGSGRAHYHTKMAMDQFHVRRDVAIQWTAAYRASCVVDVKLGRFTPNHDAPTEFTLQPSALHEEWRCFMRGLSRAYNMLSSNFSPKASAIGNTAAWTILVAQQVKKERANWMFSNNDLCLQKLDALIEELRNEKTIHNQPVVDSAGNPLFYTPGTRQPKPTAGMTDEEYDNLLSDWQQYGTQPVLCKPR